MPEDIFQRILNTVEYNSKIKMVLTYRIRESQNHRMAGKDEVGKDLWRPSSPIPLIKQGQLEQVIQDHVQSSFDYLQERRLHNTSGTPGPVFDHLHSKRFPVFRWNFMCFSLSHCLLSCQRAPLREVSGSLFFIPS